MNKKYRSSYVCVICGKRKMGKYYLCLECAQTHGVYKVPYKQWPEWLKELINMDQRERYLGNKIEEVSVDPFILAKIIENRQIM